MGQNRRIAALAHSVQRFVNACGVVGGREFDKNVVRFGKGQRAQIKTGQSRCKVHLRTQLGRQRQAGLFGGLGYL